MQHVAVVATPKRYWKAAPTFWLLIRTLTQSSTSPNGWHSSVAASLCGRQISGTQGVFSMNSAFAPSAASSLILVFLRANSKMRGAVSALCETVPSTRSEEHTSELQSRGHLVCSLLLEKK